MARKPYPSDLTEQQWKLIEDLIPPAKPGGASARGFDARGAECNHVCVA